MIDRAQLNVRLLSQSKELLLSRRSRCRPGTFGGTRYIHCVRNVKGKIYFPDTSIRCPEVLVQYIEPSMDRRIVDNNLHHINWK